MTWLGSVRRADWAMLSYCDPEDGCLAARQIGAFFFWLRLSSHRP